MRWLKFNTVGAMGMVIQIATLALGVHVLELHYLVATILSVEAALVHNFVWHIRWTWPERAGRSGLPLRPLAHFHLTAGIVSMAGNLALMRVLVGAAHLEPVLANLISIGACSLLNFVMCDRFVFLTFRNGGRGQCAL